MSARITRATNSLLNFGSAGCTRFTALRRLAMD